jgi:hypothetical protein
MRTARQKTTEKGRRIMRVAKRLLEDRGALVATAANALKWLKTPSGMRPISVRHDFFGIWDAVCVEIEIGRRTLSDVRIVYFVQVTDVDNMSHRRDKILASGFPCTSDDLILGMRPRTRKFRVLRGPRFDGTPGEWTAPPEPKKDVLVWTPAMTAAALAKAFP